ncbi:hypothetical protein [Brevundimonas intermedia]|uniref:hypothetical protein n=1 Tax=Brevundimonas intermedia TaxID=74315 RepID=UPI0032087DDC
MSDHLKRRLVALVQSQANTGRGAFSARMATQSRPNGSMTSDELGRELEHAYGADVLSLLDQAGASKFYENDLKATLGEERARAVLNHRRRAKTPTVASKPPSPPPARKQRRKVGGWTTGAATIAAILVVRAFTGAFGEGEAAPMFDEAELESGVSVEEVALERSVPVSSDTYEFGSCAQYLGAVSGLRCFNQLGGNGLPSDSPDAKDARSDIARSVRASRWRRHAQCPLFTAEVDGVSFAEASYEVLPLRDRGSLTQEALYNSCSSSANTAAYEVCSSASGMCDEGY